MSDINPDTIIVRFNRDAGQWSAWFELTPQVAFGGDLPVVAMRRLLAGTEALPDTYPLVCNSHQAGTGVLHRDLIWKPPEVLFPCPTCNGTGRYVGLIEAGTCKACAGRKVVPG